MADKAPTALTQAADSASGMALEGAEVLHVVQAANSRKASVRELARRISRRLTAAFSTSSNAIDQTITDGTTAWTVPLKSGRSYKLKVIATIQTAATGTGVTIGFKLSAGTVNVHGRMGVAIASGAVATELAATLSAITTAAGAAGSWMTSTGVAAINSPHHVYVEAVIHCTADGNLSMLMATEVNASAAQMNSGSMLILEDIT